MSKPLISGMLDNLLTQGVLRLGKVEKDQCRMRVGKAWLLKHCAPERTSQIFTDSLRMVEQLV